jgi:hypothetical protein
MIKKILGILILAGVALFVLIQVLPIGRDHRNPPVVQDAPWRTSEARVVAKQACYDCHSNETTWPWYSNIAPLSWQIQRDVVEGRQKLNFSTWGQGEVETGEIGEVIQKGEMPPETYLVLHPSAKLSSSEKEVLLQGLPGMSEGMNGSEEDESH